MRQQYQVWIATDDDGSLVDRRILFSATTDRHSAWKMAKNIGGVITVTIEYEPNELDDYIEML